MNLRLSPSRIPLAARRAELTVSKIFSSKYFEV